VSDLAAEIHAVEARRVSAMVTRDLATLGDLLADDLTYTHSGGRIDTKASFIALIADPTYIYRGVDFSDDVVVPCGADACLVRGRAQIRLENPPGTSLSYPVWYLDVYTRRADRWQMVAWQATRIPE
jgi:hypothetical protein